MKIEDINLVISERVTTDENEFNEYTRYAADCWYVQMGESDEAVYDFRELERLYQEYKKQLTIQTAVKTARNEVTQTALIRLICVVIL